MSSENLTPQELVQLQTALDLYTGTDEVISSEIQSKIDDLQRRLDAGVSQLGGVEEVNRTLEQKDPGHSKLK